MDIKDVLPLDISVKPLGKYIHAFSGFFGKYEMDVTALVIVELCQINNAWRDFYLSDLTEYTGTHNPGNAAYYIISGVASLLNYGWIVQSEDGKYSVTDQFKERCIHLSKNVRDEK